MSLDLRLSGANRKRRKRIDPRGSMKRALLWAVMVAAPLSCAGQTRSGKHSITLKFNYDFRATPACVPGVKNKKRCVAQFNAYDISAGIAKRTKLAALPVPSGATGLVKGLSLTTPSLLFESGKHLLAVTAQTPDGTESDPNKCTAWVELP